MSRRTRSGASGRSPTARGAGRRPTRRARRTTTATSTPTAIVAPPADPKAPAIVVGVWMGNSDNSPDDGHPVARIVRAALVADHRRGDTRARRSSTSASRRASRRRASTRSRGYRPGPFTTKKITELFIPGTEPTQTDDFHGRSTSTRRAAALAGRLRRPEEDGRRARLQRRRARPRELAAGRQQLDEAGRPRRGHRRRREGHPHVVLLRHGLLPLRPVMGRDLRPERALPARRRRRRLRRATTSSGCSARRPTAVRRRAVARPGQGPEALDRPSRRPGADPGSPFRA